MAGAINIGIRFFDNCCAVCELTRLQTASSPEAALHALIGAFTSPLGKRFPTLPAFVIFTGVIHCKAKHDWHGVEYGPAFYAYIKANKLGTVVEGPPRVNRQNSPSHTVRVWLWAPSQKGMMVWAAKHKSKG